MDYRLIYQIFSDLPYANKIRSSTVKLAAVLLLLLFPHFSLQANQPCWLTDLNIDQKMIYGVSSKISASNLPALHYAKANALNNWLLSEGLTELTFNKNLAPLAHFEIQGTKLYFLDHYQHKNMIYSLVSAQPHKNVATQQCEVTSCDIKLCSPLWLCENNADNITFISVATRTTIANNQLKRIIKNAQYLAKTINKTHVEGIVDLLHSETSNVKVSNIQERYAITRLSEDNPSITLGEMCVDKGTLFSHVTLDTKSIRTSHDWMDRPLLGNNLGVVGYAKGQTSTGRLSDLLQVAIRRGLFDMAKAKNINVENDLELAVNEQGYYSLMRQSHQYTESIVSAYIADMKMKINEKLQPEIFIWLLENKDES